MNPFLLSSNLSLENPNENKTGDVILNPNNKFRSMYIASPVDAFTKYTREFERFYHVEDITGRMYKQILLHEPNTDNLFIIGR